MSTQRSCPTCGSPQKPVRYLPLSPDGLPFDGSGRSFPNAEAAQGCIARWSRRYEIQGYYSTCVGERIALADLPGRCSIEEIQPGGQ